jgi:hypothetical protein
LNEHSLIINGMTIVEQNITLLDFSIFRELVCTKADDIHRPTIASIVLND